MARIPDIMDLIGANRDLNPAELRKFLAGAGPSNQWLQLGDYSTYLRRGIPKFLEKGTELKRPIDLSNIERKGLPMTEEAVAAATKRQPAKFRNPKGKFRQLLAMLEDQGRANNYDSIYVENIINEFLPEVLESAGYSQLRRANRSSVFPPEMYKRLR